MVREVKYYLRLAADFILVVGLFPLMFLMAVIYVALDSDDDNRTDS